MISTKIKNSATGYREKYKRAILTGLRGPEGERKKGYPGGKKRQVVKAIRPYLKGQARNPQKRRECDEERVGETLNSQYETN